MMKKAVLQTLCILAFSAFAAAQKIPDRSLLEQMCDSLEVRAKARLRTEGEIELRRALKRGNTLDIYLTREAGYFPWHKDDLKWFRDELGNELKGIAPAFKLGEIYAHNARLDTYCTHAVGNSGKPNAYGHVAADPRAAKSRFIRRQGAKVFNKGLSDRYIALWQSHGLYFDDKNGYWHFQRAPLFRTVEDMYTQSYVLPFLIPMLENAGAYVMTPRERDINPVEYVMDNDPSFSAAREGSIRRLGTYKEAGKWKDAGSGFADYKEAYDFLDTPFSAGTARSIQCQSKATASVTWTPDIEQRGEYAVYISYKTLDNSSAEAHYTVHHMGGDAEFLVNQKRGGGTWIYLGTFEFAEGTDGCVILDNKGSNKDVVTADAVRIGGGVGLIEREGSTSGARRHIEGALYSLPWAGADTSVTQAWATEYIDEYASRGAWVDWMKNKKDIPFDLSLAFHTDAGITPSDSTVGTLAIYTRTSEGKIRFEDGRDRITGRLLCDFVQTQVVNDIRAGFDPEWSRRGLWDKSYSETRTPGVPAMILELLSHQNFADMKLGQDPAFRFTVCRAVYKGILKTLSDFYGCPYAVQPLPVNSFSVQFSGEGKAVLNWQPTADEKEPTATPAGYIIYTRVDGGAFDGGREVKGYSAEMPIKDGHIYSYKVVAFNDGGMSFPSEILSIGRPSVVSGAEVLIVNNFDRVSAPHWTDTPGYAGFDGRFDGGVPYVRDISYIGETYEFNREAEYVDDDYPGFGACFTDHAGETVAGNTFDYPYLHGRTLMALGRPFCSVSRDAFTAAEVPAGKVIDLICGKQKTTLSGRTKEKYDVFPEPLRNSLAAASASGCNIFVSGANIASDKHSDLAVAAFTSGVLGFDLASAFASSSGSVAGMPFYTEPNPDFYCVEAPDGIKPVSRDAKTWLRYSGTNISAAVLYKTDNYKCASLGVPLETLKNETDRNYILKSVLDWFELGTKPAARR